ncbi:ectoine/hydroxyectoine ABC transporter permease subunit EhuC [Paenibacillus sp. CGMCC 1.16610]|uniref:Ectoine/hydroxyectoine ABC transporter permease subunit EhuC n=1 Tax=Paenibacillus anseongense TaxID=2682845 RepID=A0ABW9UL59_9BACL|nr:MULTISPECIES: ectoine/hydroxyectoine ABC transporter permease subunit EhuC [Paenibacillus]MBA2939803.1 ectoine/hydroxyectoine ABC transporter permease subunit EhuC [Paenibacillus sp. CGMCC 1.16610]MVQ39463.1 ectoine/hydroxyectoine ABC transporter permease subunit EhuC [Paenibacillus anseongense]
MLNWISAFEFLPILVRGAFVTLEITLFAIVLSAIISLAIGLLRLSRHRIVRFIASVYVEIFRGTSLLVQLFWLYFALPMLLNIQISAMVAAVLALGLNYGAYGSEIVRSSILAIPKGQYEAAIALNMSPSLRMRRILMPQALLLMLPSFGNLQIELLKGTSLVYLITLMDLTYQGMVLRTFDSSKTAEIFAMMLILYFILSYSLTLSLRYIERKAVGRRG